MASPGRGPVILLMNGREVRLSGGAAGRELDDVAALSISFGAADQPARIQPPSAIADVQRRADILLGQQHGHVEAAGQPAENR